LIAWTLIPAGAWMNPEFLKKFEEFGKPVTVSAGTKQVAEVRVIP